MKTSIFNSNQMIVSKMSVNFHQNANEFSFYKLLNFIHYEKFQSLQMILHNT